MKKYFKSVLLLSLVGIIFNSCKKDDPQSNTDKLCSKEWKLTAMTISPGYDIAGNGVLVTDLFSQPLINPDCVKDNFTTYKSDGTYLDDEGATKCDSSDPQTISGVWTWNSDETIITITEPGELPYSVTILTNDGTTLSGTLPFDDGSGVVYTITETYKKK